MRRTFSVLLLFVFLSTPVLTQDKVELLTEEDLVSFDNPPADTRIKYGDDPLQFGDLRVPEGDGPHPVAIFIHGGCWLAEYDISHTNKIAAALARNGIATWSLEYRRVGNDGGGWPGTYLDIGYGADHLRSLADLYNLDLGRVITMGHSAGGHLAIWLAARLTIPDASEISAEHPIPIGGVLALTPAPDLGGLHEQQVCGHVIDGLMGGSPEQYPERYRWGDPMQLPVEGVPQIIIVGKYDNDWTPSGLAYFNVAEERGDNIRLIEATESGHFEVIDPDSSTWNIVLDEAWELLQSGMP